MSDTIYLYQSVPLSAPLLFVDCVFTNSASFFITLTAAISSLFSVIPQYINWWSIHYFCYAEHFHVLTNTSAEMYCLAVMIHRHRRVTLGIVVLLTGVISQFPPKIHSPSIFFILLWGACSLQYLIPAFLRYPAGMTTRSVYGTSCLSYGLKCTRSIQHIMSTVLSGDPLPSVPHYCQPVLCNFIGFPILQIGIWQWLLRQQLHGHCFVI